MRIVPIALAIALAPSLAFAQNWTATTGTTKPTTTTPASDTPRVDPPKSKIPSAAQSRSNTGLRAGEGAADGSSIEIKRNK